MMGPLMVVHSREQGNARHSCTIPGSFLVWPSFFAQLARSRNSQTQAFNTEKEDKNKKLPNKNSQFSSIFRKQGTGWPKICINKTLWQSPCADAMWSRWRRILCLHNLQTKHQLVQFDFNLQNIFSLSGSSVPTLDGGGGISSSLEANISRSSSWIWRQ